jgi:hypothetical protein
LLATLCIFTQNSDNHFCCLTVDNRWSRLLRPNKNICVFTVTCHKNLGSVGRDNFFFLLLSTKPEIVVPGSGIRFRYLIFENSVSDKAKTLPWQCHCTNLAEYYKLAIKGDIPEESLQVILYILYVKLFIIAHYFYNKMKRIGYYHNYNTFVVTKLSLLSIERNSSIHQRIYSYMYDCFV